MKKTWQFTVTGTKFDTYEVEAETEEDAEKEARRQFRSDHESASYLFDAIDVSLDDDVE